MYRAYYFLGFPFSEPFFFLDAKFCQVTEVVRSLAPEIEANFDPGLISWSSGSSSIPNFGIGG